MKNDSKEQVEAYNKFANQFNIAISSNESIFPGIVISMVSLIVLGAFLYLILVGIFMAFTYLAMMSERVYGLFQKLTRLPQLPTYFVAPPLSRLRSAYIILIMPVGLVYFGINGVFSDMFCTSSFLCMLIRYGLP